MRMSYEKYSMKLTSKQLHTLCHMLGINTPYDRVPKPYRNHAAVNPGDPEFVELERLGAVKKFRTPKFGTEYDWYECTEEGKLTAIRLHRDIRKNRKQRTYHKFLEVLDCCPDLTFKEFLTSEEFRETRKNA